MNKEIHSTVPSIRRKAASTLLPYPTGDAVVSRWYHIHVISFLLPRELLFSHSNPDDVDTFMHDFKPLVSISKSFSSSTIS
jgi:hypothetical protein